MITIKLKEKENKLSLTCCPEPIICGNSNYALDFDFSEEWKIAENKLAVLDINGERIFAKFEDTIVKLPIFPNASKVLVSVVSGKDTESQLSTTPVELKLEHSRVADNLPEAEPIKNAIAEFLGTINGLKNGRIIAKQAEISNNVSNSNLLLNGDFRVNQRNKAAYVCTKNEYTVDRWLGTNGLTVTTKDSGVLLSATATCKFEQKLEMDYASFSNEMVTISAKIGNTKYSKSALMPVQKPTVASKLISLDIAGGNKLKLMINNTGIVSFVIELVAGASFKVFYAKLEFGEVATTFIPRLYAEELSLCQRYYQNIRISGNAITASSTSKLYPSVPIAVPFRAKGTLTETILPYIRNNGQNIQATSVVLNTIYDNCVVLEITRSQADLVSSNLYATANGQAIIDAEIY